MPHVITFESGWSHIRFTDDEDLGFRDTHCFVQIPSDFSGTTIPDAAIFDTHDFGPNNSAARWNRAPVNRWWSEYRAGRAASA